MGEQITLKRIVVPADECHWCGQKPHVLFDYGHPIRSQINHAGFCNLGCFLSYSDLSRHDFDYVEFMQS